MAEKFITAEKESFLIVLEALKAGGMSDARACSKIGLPQSTVCGWRREKATPGAAASQAAYRRKWGRSPVTGY